jgi:DNA-binding MarR family transcriptional regulator
MKPQRNPSAPVQALSRNAVMALMRENGHLTRVLFRRRMKTMPVTGAEARTLLYLGANQGATQRVLATLLDIQPITLTRQLDRLEALDYVDRRFDDADRRVRLLHLTGKGKALARRILAIHDELDEKITAALTDDDIEKLAIAMGRINSVLVTLR